MQFSFKKLKDAEVELKVILDEADLGHYVKKAMEELSAEIQKVGEAMYAQKATSDNNDEKKQELKKSRKALFGFNHQNLS